MLSSICGSPVLQKIGITINGKVSLLVKGKLGKISHKVLESNQIK